jgi:hypothetical protein
MGDEVGGYAVGFGLVLVCLLAAIGRGVEILVARKRGG